MSTEPRDVRTFDFQDRVCRLVFTNTSSVMPMTVFLHKVERYEDGSTEDRWEAHTLQPGKGRGPLTLRTHIKYDKEGGGTLRATDIVEYGAAYRGEGCPPIAGVYDDPRDAGVEVKPVDNPCRFEGTEIRAPVGFTADDCQCRGTTGRWAREVEVKSNSMRDSLWCDITWGLQYIGKKIRYPSKNIVRIRASRRLNESDPEGLQKFERLRGEMKDWNAGKTGTETGFEYDEHAKRYTGLSYVHSESAPDYGWRYGKRIVLYKGSVIEVSVNADTLSDEDELRARLDAAEQCATAAIDRYDVECPVAWYGREGS